MKKSKTKPVAPPVVTPPPVEAVVSPTTTPTAPSMTVSELHDAIKNALMTVPFTGLDVAYTGLVYAEIKRCAPLASVDVYHRHRCLEVEARCGSTRYRLSPVILGN